MKKRNDKKTNNENVDLKELSDDLGLYGIEPPTIYRNNKSNEELYSNSESRIRKVKNSNPKSNKKPRRKKFKLKKKYKNILSGIVTIIAAIIIIAILCVTVFFKANTIKIEGNKKYETKQILNTLSVEKGDSLLIIDNNKINAELTEELPYIESVEITKKLPSNLIIKVNEVKDIYYVKNKEKTYTLIDKTFKVVNKSSNKIKKNYICLDGVSLTDSIDGQQANFKSEKQKTKFKEIINAINNHKIKNVTSIRSKDEYNNSFIIDKRIEVKLGSTKNIDHKIDVALASISKYEESNPEAKGVMHVESDKQYYFTKK